MRFRFTIRDLLWLTACAAVCVAWWVDHNRPQSNRYYVSDGGGLTLTVIDIQAGTFVSIPTSALESPDRPHQSVLVFHAATH